MVDTRKQHVGHRDGVLHPERGPDQWYCSGASRPVRSKRTFSAGRQDRQAELAWPRSGAQPLETSVRMPNTRAVRAGHRFT